MVSTITAISAAPVKNEDYDMCEGSGTEVGQVAGPTTTTEPTTTVPVSQGIADWAMLGRPGESSESAKQAATQTARNETTGSTSHGVQ